ncbi:copper resistance protein NlpE [Faecalibacter rhinopitheci]|uniref:Copper resistance protein NlpE N-terminal domain-containing protein n=1 Tax=Faecalibacter rhinopitheci TaxID=2779678 RepID=A0A8J7G8Y6_9FLAO|nr:copper resistance protein NlpE N-terminal domain-containing protein [Faecalibacter rhinopitheci]MBF0597575.1 copper resistance protein NlpE N-terminal domain-containing protein [Faecalibacter rhinopitheci]MBQ0148635.1 copper resistance protein NlpE N-terminal domain-containing protein [Candidatus Onthonaster equi]
MKRFVIACLVATGLLFVSSCKNETETVDTINTNDTIQLEDSISTASNAENSIDYIGSYEGILPCIDTNCKEIELSLKLMPDNIFVYSTKRIDIDKEALMTTGTYHFEQDGNTIVLDQISNVPNAFFIAEGKIYQLDKEQNKIEGANAEKFILKKK